MFVDKVKITIKAGDGGNGAISFLRDKFTIKGGPDGGDGGKGGDVVIVCTSAKNTLIDYYYKRKFFADNGENGSKRNMDGKNGASLKLEVPVGTIVRNAETNEILCDLKEDKAEFIVLRGGKGGRGNSKFASSTRQSPGFSELGEKSKEYEVILELKIIADVGLIGFPNVGKSTLLSIISNAKPKIANYHFTTLSPNLGVCKVFDDSFVVADIPGLIEGASMGAGLGHEFLRHIERTRLLINVVDASEQEGRNIIDDIKTINNELNNFGETLKTLPQIIVLNKCDLAEDVDKKIEKIKNDKSIKQLGIYAISGATREGVDKLVQQISKELKKLDPIDTTTYISGAVLDKKDVTSIVVTRDSKGVFHVTGGYVENLSRYVVLDDAESFAYFQKRLREDGVIDALKQKGAKDGDEVNVLDISFTFVD